MPLFQEQISRDFKKFELHPENRDSGASAVADNLFNVKSDINLLIATLIATVTFTAALAPPGGYGDDGKMILRDNTNFRWFQSFNYMSFVLSLMVLLHESVVPFLGRLGSKVSKLVALFKPESLTVVSLYGMLIAIVAGTLAGRTSPQKSLSVDPFIYLAVIVVALSAMAPALQQPVVDIWNEFREKRSGSIGPSSKQQIVNLRNEIRK